MLKPLALAGALCTLTRPALLAAQATAWQPAPGHVQLPLWPAVPPDARRATVPAESAALVEGPLVAGSQWTYVSNASRPTIAGYSPDADMSVGHVLVLRGGGYNILAIDLAGTEACDWLTSKGIT